MPPSKVPIGDVCCAVRPRDLKTGNIHLADGGAVRIPDTPPNEAGYLAVVAVDAHGDVFPSVSLKT